MKWLFSIAFIGICSCLVADEKKETPSDKKETPPAVKPATPLVEFVPEGLKLKCLLPGKAELKEFRTNGAKVRAWMVDEKTHGYALMVVDLPQVALRGEKRTPAEQLEAALKSGLSFTKLSEEKAKSVKLGNYVGIETTGTMGKDEKRIKVRVYLIDQKLVHLVVMGPPEITESEDATRVLESLKVDG